MTILVKPTDKFNCDDCWDLLFDLEPLLQIEKTYEIFSIKREIYDRLKRCPHGGKDAILKPVMCECGCGCEEIATTFDDWGTPVCDKCADIAETDDGVVCARRTKKWTVCHVCGKEIEWGTLHTEGYGPNYRYGCCGCGWVWICEYRGKPTYGYMTFL